MQRIEACRDMEPATFQKRGQGAFAPIISQTRHACYSRRLLKRSLACTLWPSIRLPYPPCRIARQWLMYTFSDDPFRVSFLLLKLSIGGYERDGPLHGPPLIRTPRDEWSTAQWPGSGGITIVSATPSARRSTSHSPHYHAWERTYLQSCRQSKSTDTNLDNVVEQSVLGTSSLAIFSLAVSFFSK